MALASSSFQLFATSAASGSSGLGAPRRAWMESRMVRICRAGDQLSAIMERKIYQPEVRTILSTIRGGDRKGKGKRRGGSHTLQHVQADAAQLVDVRVVDLGQESDLRRRHRVLVRQEELELEHAICADEETVVSATKVPSAGSRRGLCPPDQHTLVRRAGRAVDLDVKVSQVVLVGGGADTGDAGGQKMRHYVSRRLVIGGGECIHLPGTYGSATRRSVSLIIRLGRPAIVSCVGG